MNDLHEVLTRVTDDLHAPDDLVARGMARGRARRRRNLAATGVAGFALAAVAVLTVPQLMPGSGSGQDVRRGEPGVASQPGAEVGARSPIDAASGAEVLTSLMPEGEVRDATNDVEAPVGVATGGMPPQPTTEVASRLVFNGGVVEAEVFRFHSEADEQKARELGAPLETAAEACTYGDASECVKLEDGSFFYTGTGGFREEWMGESIGYLVTSATLWTTDGYVVRLFAYNVGPENADAEYGQLTGEERERFVLVNGGEPVLTPAELQAIATSPEWFQPAL